MFRKVDRSKPRAVLLGGGRSALEVARCLGVEGVEVFTICAPGDVTVHSRFSKPIVFPNDGDYQKLCNRWQDYLLGPESDWLEGSVLLTTSDAGILIINTNAETLRKKFILDVAEPEAQLRLLYKHSTYEEAVKAGVPTPNFWIVRSEEELNRQRRDFSYPLIIKPLLSHQFENTYHAKHFRAANEDELDEAFRKVLTDGIEVIVVERIPGRDDQLCSYYTYLNEHGEPEFHYTKRMVRRFPAGMGSGVCQQTAKDLPEVQELSLKLFKSSGVKGLLNTEYIRDRRDGTLKLIECNGRFTGVNRLLIDSGLNINLHVYNRLTGGPAVPLGHYRDGPMFWDPIGDLYAFRERRKTGELTLFTWIRTLKLPIVLPVFQWDDPVPSLIESGRLIGRAVKKIWRVLTSPFRRRLGPRQT